MNRDTGTIHDPLQLARSEAAAAAAAAWSKQRKRNRWLYIVGRAYHSKCQAANNMAVRLWNKLDEKRKMQQKSL
jgi:hypothetical protein